MKIFLQGKNFFFAIAFLYSGNLFSVCDNVTVSGTITGNQTICGSYNPTAMTNVTYPTGGTGTLQYQWQVSTNATTWTDIAGATLESYDPSTISITTYYHRLERRSSCTVYSGTSNMITKTVNPLPSASITAGGPIIFCSPGSVLLTANSVAGTTYQWKKNNTSIAGETNQTYTATTTGSYTVVKTITATGCSATSNAISVTAEAALTTTVTEPGFNNCAASTVLLEAPYSTIYTYQWFEDSHSLPNTNYYQYNTGHNGNFSCTITNTCGSYPSPTYVLNSPFLQFQTYGYINPNGSTSICTGASVQLYETYNWNTFPGYQWYLNGSIINGATNYNYFASQAGDYVLRVTAPCWNNFTYIDYYTNWITVTNNGGVAPTPSISAGGPTTFCQGSNVTLTEVTGVGWTYQWMKNNATIAGATNSTYLVTTSGSYLCNVSNTCGTFPSNTIAVTVQPVTATITASTLAICAGNPVTFTSSSAGTGGTYQWKLNGSSIGGATSITYTTPTGAPGNYTCSITNSCGTFTSNTLTLTNLTGCATGLKFDGTNDYVKVPNNAAYSFGTGNFSIEAWVNLDANQTYNYPSLMSNRNTANFNTGFFAYFYLGRPSLMIAGTTNIVSNVDLRDNNCHHVAFTRSASTFTIYVDGVVVLTGGYAAGSVTTSDPLYICNDVAYFTYPRMRGMEFRLWNVARTQAQIQAAMNTTLTGNETGLVGYWKLNDGSGQIANDYSTINNDGQLGSTSGVDSNDPVFQSTCPISATVNCNLPSGLNTTNITNTSAQLNWTGATADSFMVRYAIHNTTNFVWKKFSGQPNVTSTTITSLLPATQYDWWVRSLCNGGSSSNYQSIPAAFTTTTTPVPCVVPYGLNATNIGNTSATISWTTMVTADTFRVRYSVNGTTNFTWKDVNGASGSSTSLIGLSPNITYQFQVSSKCNGVTSAYSSSFVFTTLNTPVACVTPYGLGANNIQNTSATITWTNLVSADTFRIRYSVNGTTNFTWKDVNGGGAHSTLLSNLIPNTTYQFQVSSKCNGVTSAYSSSFIFATLNQPVPCIVPYGLSTTNITNNSAKVNWTNLVSADTFRVRYSINGTTNFIWKDVNGAGGVTNTTLTGLNSSSTYQWQVRTVCNGAQSAYSSSIIFSTAAMREAAITGNGFENLVVYPNPAHLKSTVEFTSDEKGNGVVTISDMTARIFSSEPFTIHEGLNMIEIDIATLPRGIYIVQLQNENSTSAIVKLVVE
jgi:hypothetical protein